MTYIATCFPDFIKQAEEELRAADCAVRLTRLSPGLLRAETAAADFAAALRGVTPVFVRHIMPVYATGALSGDREMDCDDLRDAALACVVLPPGTAFCVQCRVIGGDLDYKAKDVEVFLGRLFEQAGAAPVFSDREIGGDAAQVISVLLLEGVYYLGFSAARDNLSAHSDEYRVLSRGGGRAVSRAENKLKEAISAFGIPVGHAGNALDLGAAPGGWTKVLADFGYTVYAVDPAVLHETVLAHPNVVHCRCRIEQLALEQAFDLIVNDMNIDPQQTARIMLSVADRLVADGQAVVTLKLPFRDVARSLSESIEILKEAYHIRAVRNLTHNRREVTAWLRKRG